MADFNAIAAVSRTLRRLIADRMATPVTVTLAPPDVVIAGLNSPRINLYLFKVAEQPQLRNQAIAGHEHPAVFGRPALSLTLLYLMTSHARTEDQIDSDIIAQALLGDAMLALHEFGGALEELSLVTNRVGAVGERLMDPVLQDEFERVKVVHHPATLDEMSRLWSAIPAANFRRTALYEASVVQIEPRLPRRQSPPVATRRIFVSASRPPRIADAYLTPAPGSSLRDFRVAVGQEITIEHDPLVAERLYVRFGELDPIRVPLPTHGVVRINVPDDVYPVDLDNPVVRPIAPRDRLQPGALEVTLISVAATEGVGGGLDRGAPVSADRGLRSNTALLQLTPFVAAATPPFGQANAILRLTGTRLWAEDRLSVVIVGDAAIPVRPPGVGDPWAAPTPTQVEIPVSAVVALLATSPTPYPVAAQLGGMRSVGPPLTFRLDP